MPGATEYPSTEDNAEHLLHFIDTPGFSQPTVTSGTPVQNATNDWATVYVQINAGASGTVKAEVSLDGVTYYTVIAATANNAVAAQVVTLRVPPNGYFRITTVTSTIAAATAYTD